MGKGPRQQREFPAWQPNSSAARWAADGAHDVVPEEGDVGDSGDEEDGRHAGEQSVEGPSRSGGWRQDGLARVRRHKVLALLRRRGLLSQDRIDLLLSWRRSGFSVHNRVYAHPDEGRDFEALATSPEGLLREQRPPRSQGELSDAPRVGNSVDSQAPRSCRLTSPSPVWPVAARLLPP